MSSSPELSTRTRPIIPSAQPRYSQAATRVTTVLALVPGVSQVSFARIAGISQRTLTNIMNPTHHDRVVKQGTYDKIMAVSPRDLAQEPRRVLIDGAATQALVDHLVARGYTVREIAHRAGLGANTLSPGNLSRVHTDTALAVQRVYRQLPHAAVPPDLVPACGVTRRVDALRVMGWPLRALAAEAGTSALVLSASSSRGARRTQAVHQRVVGVYQELKFTIGPSARAVQEAKFTGCAPWAAWTNESRMDDPHRQPDYNFVEDPVWAAAIRDRYRKR